jgi:ketosteroid isomerase-like protein
MTEPSRSVDRKTAETMLRAMHEHTGGSPTADILDFIHPDAEMRLLVSFNRLVSGRDAVVEALEHGRQAAIFRAHVERFEWLDDQTSLTFARARYALEQGGYAEGRVVWLDEIRDGKIWRVRNFTHEADARRAYELGEDADAPEA